MSSAVAHLGLAKDFRAEQGGAAGWADLLATPGEAMETRLLRRCTYAGRPFGEDGYVALLEQQLQRVWRKWGLEEARQVGTFAG